MEGDSGERFFALAGYIEMSPDSSSRKKDKHFRKAKAAFDRAIDHGVHPLIHRVASSKEYSDRLIDVKREWTCKDLADALWWLDAINEASQPEKPDLDNTI